MKNFILVKCGAVVVIISFFFENIFREKSLKLTKDMETLIKEIGWIGTGVMGKSMCKHLLRSGYSLSVFNRTKSKTDDLLASGAVFLTPVEIAQKCDTVFLMLGYPQDIEDVLFNKEAILNHLKPGAILVDHTTSSPKLAERIYAECKTKGVSSLDAPVSGGDVGAKEGKLVIMTGGDEAAFNKVTPIFKSYGTNIKLMGGPGKGQHTKMVNQIIIVNTMLGVVEGLIYGYKAGLDLERVIETIGGGAAASFSLNVLGPRMLKRNFDPGFYVEHFIKDLEIALEEARRMNLCLPGLGLIKQFYQSLAALGGAKMGTQALLLVLEKMNNVDLSKKMD